MLNIKCCPYVKIVQFVSDVAAVSDTRRESFSGQGRLDNGITRGSDTIMDVDIFWIACPFCTNYRKGEKNPSIL